VLSQQPELTAEHASFYEACLNELIASDAANMEPRKLLIRQLYKEHRMEGLTAAALSMAASWPESSYPLEWICKAYLEWAADTLGGSRVNVPLCFGK
jgi:hypothetical protein